MRIGIVGLGGIAQKAYLPVITSRADVELVLCTRNAEALNKVSKMYRISEGVHTVEELIEKGVDAAFIHTSTESHVEVATKLLKAGIHVYVDKPISYSYEEAFKLVELAEKQGKILMVGFNRRFAPMNAMLKDKENPDIVLIEKNRTFSPNDARVFVFDDFIHVVDTLRFLSPGEAKDVRINYSLREGKLYNVSLQLLGEDFMSMGIMNRDNGVSEEIVEFMNPGNKWVVRDLVNTVHYSNGEEKIIKFKDWDPTLYRRGFYQIIDHFISCVKNNIQPNPSAKDSLVTHELCEKIVREIESR